MPTVKCRGRAGGEILTVGNELYQENKKASGLKGEKSTVDRTHSTGYFFCPKLEGGFIPQPRQPHFSEDIHRQTDRHHLSGSNNNADIWIGDSLHVSNIRMSLTETDTGRALKYSWWRLHWLGGRAGDDSKDSRLWPLGGEEDGHAAGLGLCLPEAASRNKNSSDSRCRKRSEAVRLKISPSPVLPEFRCTLEKSNGLSSNFAEGIYLWWYGHVHFQHATDRFWPPKKPTIFFLKKAFHFWIFLSSMKCGKFYSSRSIFCYLRPTATSKILIMPVFAGLLSNTNV